jgi:hypothetical protein
MPRLRLSAFFFLTLLVASAFAADVATIARDRVLHAERLCGAITLTPAIDPTTGKISERPIAICALKESDQSWHAIEIAVEFPVPDTYKMCVRMAPTLDDRRNCKLKFRVVTAGYELEHLGGYGLARMSFDAYQTVVRTLPGGKVVNVRDEQLIPYRTQYTWFDDAAIASGDSARMLATATFPQYTPYHPLQRSPELVVAGAEFLRKQVLHAQYVLNKNSVTSLAFQGREVSDVVPWEIVFALAIIEQMDDKKFEADQAGTAENVLVEYALNRDRAFEWSQSGARALGPMQFTNSGQNGTYDTVRAKYPSANLDPDFVSGASSLPNSLMAAFLLIDLEISQQPEIHSIYKRDPLVGGIFPVAAYNGSPTSARLLYQHVKNKKLTRHDLAAAAQSTARYCRCGKAGNIPPLNSETRGYVIKYAFIINNFIKHKNTP